MTSETSQVIPIQHIPYSRSRQAGESQDVLDHIVDDFQDNPESMQYFYDLFRRVYCHGEEVPHEGMLVGTTCIQAPEELIYAFGATPMRLCNGSYHYDQKGADFMPAKSCSLVKATLGMLNSETVIPKIGKPDMIVNPTTCDQKKKSSVMMQDMGYKVYDLEFPNVKESEASRVYWQRSVRQFASELRQLTGKKLSKKNLQAAMNKTGRAQAAFRKLHSFRLKSPSLILGKDAFLVTNAYFFDDITRWTVAVEKLNAELELRDKSGFKAVQSKAPRVLFTGSPPIFPNLKLPLLIEEAGGVVVADETCSANRMLYDMTAVDEWLVNDMVDSLADKYLKPCTCPIFTNNSDRLRRLVELALVLFAVTLLVNVVARLLVWRMTAVKVATD